MAREGGALPFLVIHVCADSFLNLFQQQRIALRNGFQQAR
jgi:hypothetical protein